MSDSARSLPLRVAGATAAAFGAIAVLLGAFAAHGLRGHLSDAALQVWHTAVDYQFWHALAMLAAALMPAERWRCFSAYAFGVGIVLFCGSLYALALDAPKWVGAITPFGGVAFILGWIALAVGFLSRRDN